MISRSEENVSICYSLLTDLWYNNGITSTIMTMTIATEHMSIHKYFCTQPFTHIVENLQNPGCLKLVCDNSILQKFILISCCLSFVHTDAELSIVNMHLSFNSCLLEKISFWYKSLHGKDLIFEYMPQDISNTYIIVTRWNKKEAVYLQTMCLCLHRSPMYVLDSPELHIPNFGIIYQIKKVLKLYGFLR